VAAANVAGHATVFEVIPDRNNITAERANVTFAIVNTVNNCIELNGIRPEIEEILSFRIAKGRKKCVIVVSFARVGSHVREQKTQ